MSDISSRLAEARKKAGYATASDAARAMGLAVPSYSAHENGTRPRGASENAERYARFYRVSLEWLLTGKGEMRPPANHQHFTIPVDGIVGAGFAVQPVDDDQLGDDTVEMPGDGTLGALRVRGDSQYPRFQDGEVVIYDRRPVLIPNMANKLAVVQLADGRRLVKTLRRGPGDTWTLESHNAPPEHNAQILGVWRVIGVLTS